MFCGKIPFFSELGAWSSIKSIVLNILDAKILKTKILLKTVRGIGAAAPVGSRCLHFNDSDFAETIRKSGFWWNSLKAKEKRRRRGGWRLDNESL
jgi:hypothetical protein